MKKMDIEEVREIQLKVLCELHDFCCDNKINYYLAYGTLLGAIRHKGYIPWDDDIDILMLRQDYDKFLNIYNSQGKQFRLRTLNDKNYYLPFSKLEDCSTVLKEEAVYDSELGINIDVFPLDKLSSKWNLFCIIIMRSIYKLKIVKKNKSRGKVKNLILILSQFFLKPLSIHWCCKFIDKKAKLGFRNEKLFCFDDCEEKKVFDVEIFKERILLEFEGKKFYAPKMYNKFLEIQYGDYMQLPPVSKRITHHAFSAYKKESEI